MEHGNSSWLKTCMRRIAYDFHIPDNHEDFLSRLDPQHTADVISEAGVQMLQLCAKSHWGLSLHPTKVGKQHPLLVGRDYFGEVLKALQLRGVRCMAYISDYWDNYAATTHPDWRHVSLEQVKKNEQPGEEFWMTMCPETGYEEYLRSQIAEVLQNYPVDGIFLDMTGFLGHCYCDSCKIKFRKDAGLNLPEKEDMESPVWRKYIKWRYEETERIAGERRELIKSINPDIVFSHNYHGNFYHYYALSHDTVSSHRYTDYLSAETAPWDIAFGLIGSSQAAKFVRDAACGKSFEAVGARSAIGHDFSHKPLEEIMLDTYSVAANNCPYVIIESANWDGLPVKSGFDLIKKAFTRMEQLDPWIMDSQPVQYAGLMYSRSSADFYSGSDKSQILAEMNGFYKACIEKHLPVGFLFDQTIMPENISKYKVIILPDISVLNRKQCNVLREYVKNGGGLVATHQSALYDEDGKEYEDFLLADVFGCNKAGRPSDEFIWMTADSGDKTSKAGMEGSIRQIPLREEPNCVPIKPAEDATVLARKTYAPFGKPGGLNHTSHGEPPYKETEDSLVIANTYGKGRCIYISPRIGTSYVKYGYEQLRELMYNYITWAANHEGYVYTDAPMSVEIILNTQSNRVVMHALNFSCRPSIPYTVMDFPGEALGPMKKSYLRYDEVIVLKHLTFWISLDKQPERVYLVPSGQELDFKYENGKIGFALNILGDAATICIEYGV